MTAKTGFLMERSERVIVGLQISECRLQNEKQRRSRWSSLPFCILQSAFRNTPLAARPQQRQLVLRDRQWRTVLERLGPLADDDVAGLQALEHLDPARLALAQLQRHRLGEVLHLALL